MKVVIKIACELGQRLDVVCGSVYKEGWLFERRCKLKEIERDQYEWEESVRQLACQASI